jgi:hypothetical protein
MVAPVEMELPSIVPVTVAVWIDVEAVRVAVYVPSLLSVTLESEPWSAESVTTPPDDVSGFPWASFA